MKALPYYKMYPADAETDERFKSMSDTEKGFYWRCLNHCWINGSLPADPSERAKALGNPQSYADRMWERVGRCFSPMQGGSRVINPRQEEERSKAICKSEKATESIRKRYERSSDVSIRALTHAVSVSVSGSVVSSEKEKKEFERVEKIWLDAGFRGPDYFERWWDQIVLNHLNRSRNIDARMRIFELILEGTFKREEFDTGYQQLRESKADDWEREGGKYCTNLYEIVYNRLWKFKPAETDSWIRELAEEQELERQKA